MAGAGRGGSPSGLYRGAGATGDAGADGGAAGMGSLSADPDSSDVPLPAVPPDGLEDGDWPADARAVSTGSGGGGTAEEMPATPRALVGVRAATPTPRSTAGASSTGNATTGDGAAGAVAELEGKGWCGSRASLAPCPPCTHAHTGAYSDQGGKLRPQHGRDLTTPHNAGGSRGGGSIVPKRQQGRVEEWASSVRQLAEVQGSVRPPSAVGWGSWVHQRWPVRWRPTPQHCPWTQCWDNNSRRGKEAHLG